MYYHLTLTISWKLHFVIWEAQSVSFVSRANFTDFRGGYCNIQRHRQKKQIRHCGASNAPEWLNLFKLATEIVQKYVWRVIFNSSSSIASARNSVKVFF